jgi:hypothetical protein
MVRRQIACSGFNKHTAYAKIRSLLKKLGSNNMQSPSFESSEYLPPAGVELMHETPELTVRGLGNVASGISLQGSSDADGTETTSSMDPGTMDPYTMSEPTGREYGLAA